MAAFGFTLIYAGGIAIIVSIIWLVVVAARESALQAVLVLFVPLYFVFYVITRWKTCKGPALSYIASALVIGIGIVVVASAPSG